jgi:hypothetical protein
LLELSSGKRVDVSPGKSRQASNKHSGKDARVGNGIQYKPSGDELFIFPIQKWYDYYYQISEG